MVVYKKVRKSPKGVGPLLRDRTLRDRSSGLVTSVLPTDPACCPLMRLLQYTHKQVLIKEFSRTESTLYTLYNF